MSKPATAKRWPVLLALFGVVVVWGVAFSGIKVLLETMDPYVLTTSRLVIAASTYTIIIPFLPRGRARFERRDLSTLVLLGVFGAAGYHLPVNWGQQHISAGLSSLIVASMPAMVAMLAAIFLRERLSRRATIGLVIAFAGVGVLSVSGEGALTADNLAGALVTFLAPVSWSIYTILSKPLAARYDGVRLNVIGAWFGALITLPLALGGIDVLGRLTANEWLWLIYLSAFSTSMSYIVYSWALRSMKATAVASFVQLVPASSLLWAWILLDEVPASSAILGGLLVIAGVALVQARSRSLVNAGR